MVHDLTATSHSRKGIRYTAIICNRISADRRERSGLISFLFYVFTRACCFLDSGSFAEGKRQAMPQGRLYVRTCDRTLGIDTHIRSIHGGKCAVSPAVDGNDRCMVNKPTVVGQIGDIEPDVGAATDTGWVVKPSMFGLLHRALFATLWYTPARSYVHPHAPMAG